MYFLVFSALILFSLFSSNPRLLGMRADGSGFLWGLRCLRSVLGHHFHCDLNGRHLRTLNLHAFPGIYAVAQKEKMGKQKNIVCVTATRRQVALGMF